MNARWYNSSVGRFMSEDTYFGTMTNPQSQNQYAYVMNNPVNMWDPTGNVPSWVGDEAHVDTGTDSDGGAGTPTDAYIKQGSNATSSGWYLTDTVVTPKKITYYYEAQRTTTWTYTRWYDYETEESSSGNGYSGTPQSSETVTYTKVTYYRKTEVDTAEDRAERNAEEIKKLAGDPPDIEDEPFKEITYYNSDEVVLSQRSNFNSISQDEKATVSELQKQLNAVLGKNLKVDGKYGTNTTDALMAFQKSCNLPQQEGKLDESTSVHLETAFMGNKTDNNENSEYIWNSLELEKIYDNANKTVQDISKSDRILRDGVIYVYEGSMPYFSGFIVGGEKILLDISTDDLHSSFIRTSAMDADLRIRENEILEKTLNQLGNALKSAGNKIIKFFEHDPNNPMFKTDYYQIFGDDYYK